MNKVVRGGSGALRQGVVVNSKGEKEVVELITCDTAIRLALSLGTERGREVAQWFMDIRDGKVKDSKGKTLKEAVDGSVRTFDF